MDAPLRPCLPTSSEGQLPAKSNVCYRAKRLRASKTALGLLEPVARAVRCTIFSSMISELLGQLPEGSVRNSGLVSTGFGSHLQWNAHPFFGLSEDDLACRNSAVRFFSFILRIFPK